MSDTQTHSKDESTDNTSAQKPIPRWILKLMTRINVVVYKASNGRLMNSLAGMPIIMVGMTGAKSGQPRTIPLMYVPDGDNFLLVASQCGAPKNPVWYNNLVKYPEVDITFQGKTIAMRATVLSEEEKAAVWPICVEYYPPYADYQKLTTRSIPVFRCTPIA